VAIATFWAPILPGGRAAAPPVFSVVPRLRCGNRPGCGLDSGVHSRHARDMRRQLVWLMAAMLLMTRVAQGDEPARLAEKDAAGEESVCLYPLLRKIAARECEQVPAAYGTTPASPLEWGYGGMSGPSGPNAERLLCPSGATPTATRRGSGPAPDDYHSTATSTFESRTAASDTLDIWSVKCPEDARPRSWYVNVYRCGPPCIPRGFRLMSMDAYQSMIESRKATESQDLPRSLELARKAHVLEPHSEVIEARRPYRVASSCGLAVLNICCIDK